MLFPSARHVRQTGYPYRQLTGPVPRTENLGTLTLAQRKPTAKTWPWELPFLADLLSWTQPGTVTFIQLALDFEETSQRTLPTAPQAKYRGTALPLQERAKVLRLALCTNQKLVTRGALHPAKVITRANSVVPLGGPQQSGLSRRPYFVSRRAMVGHIAKLSQYCEETWALRAHSRQNKARSYVYRHRRSPQMATATQSQQQQCHHSRCQGCWHHCVVSGGVGGAEAWAPRVAARRGGGGGLLLIIGARSARCLPRREACRAQSVLGFARGAVPPSASRAENVNRAAASRVAAHWVARGEGAPRVDCYSASIMCKA